MAKNKNGNLFFLLWVIICFLGVNYDLPSVFAKEKNLINSRKYVADEIIVKYKDNRVNLKTSSGKNKVASINNLNNLEKKEDIVENNISVLRITDGSTVEQKISELEKNLNIEYVQPNYQYYLDTIDSNDVYKNNLWGLDNFHQVVNGYAGTNDADIDAPEAWGISGVATSSIVVAVIDSGVAYNHPDLISNMWDGANCKDEDGNYLGSCNYGYDFVDDDKTPLPDISEEFFYHGTHVAGIIAAEKNNSKGIVGVNPRAKIMAIRSSLTSDNIIKNINFAKQNGAQIINASWGGSGNDLAIREAIELFPGLFVAAAGNGGEDFVGDNNEDVHYYPSDFDLTNIISVAATEQNDALANFSNYGIDSVDVGAPGVNILSSVTNNGLGSDELYAYSNGTSMAAAYVSGVAALILENNSLLSATDLKNIIITTGDSKDSLIGKTVSGKRINAYQALLSLDTTSPEASIQYSQDIVKAGDNLNIIANFNEAIADFPGIEFSISGGNVATSVSMTKISNTEYSCDYIVGLGDGIATISFSTGTDLFGNIINPSPISGATFMVDNTAPTNQDLVFATSTIKKGGAVLNINLSIDDSDTIWLAPVNTTIFNQGQSMTKTLGSSSTITTPSLAGDYKLFVIDRAGNISTASLATLTIDNTLPPTPIITTIASNNIINVSNKSSVIITGSAEANSLVSAILSDGLNSIKVSKQLINNETDYNIILDIASATPETLQDGLINVSVEATNYLENVSLLATSTVIQDTLRPQIDSVQTVDLNSNGKIDAIKIIFSENIKDSTVSVNDFSVFGYLGINFDTSTNSDISDDNIIYLTFSEGVDFDSSVSPALSYISGNLSDLADNLLLSTTTNAIDMVTPGLITLGDGFTDFVMTPGDYSLIFSESLTTNSQLAIETSIKRGATEELIYNWQDNVLIITATATTTFANDVIASVADLVNNNTNLLLIDSSLDSFQTTPNKLSLATINSITTQVVINNHNQEAIINISSDAINPSINVSPFTDGITAIVPKITINAANVNNLIVRIPTSTTITSSDPSWGGVFSAPVTTEIALPVTSGQIKTLSSAISVGLANAKLSFDKSVKIIFPGQLNKRVGYALTGATFVEITTNCGENSQVWADNNLGVDGECKTSEGSDLVIWTKHFTKFATYTQESAPIISSGGGGGGGGSVGSSTNYCSAVIYSPWQNCINNKQFRSVLSSTPNNCVLTTDQQISLSQACQLVIATTTPDSIIPDVINNENNSGSLANDLIAAVVKISNSVTTAEQKLTTKINPSLIKKLAGRILLQVETKGQAWYLDKVSLKRYYLADGPSAYQALRKFGLGITNNDLAKIPVASTSALPSDYIKSAKYSTTLTNKLKGRIVLQVENHGEAWYINPVDGLRYYLANGEAAYQIMRNLSLGITNSNIHTITVGNW